MSELILAYLPIVDLILIGAGYGLSQFLFLRAGLFSVATAGLACVGAYGAALAVMRLNLSLWPALVTGMALGAGLSALLALPLARLKGVYQAIATIAFVEIVHSITLLAETWTGGAGGLNGIPKLAGGLHVAAAVALTLVVLIQLGRTGLGRAWDAIREDAAVAVSLGVNIRKYNLVAFLLGGAIAGLFGALDALSNYALTPNQFGFHLLVASLSYVVLGGRKNPFGPLLGAAVLVLLPELFRGFSEFRTLAYGAILIVVITYLPKGIVEPLVKWTGALRRSRLRVGNAGVNGVQGGRS